VEKYYLLEVGGHCAVADEAVALFFRKGTFLTLGERISVCFLGNHKPSQPEKWP